MMLPLYRVWPARNRFCCYGNCVTGPEDDIITNAYTWVCICGVTVPYIVLVGPVLWRDLSPAVSFPTYFLFVSTVFFLLLTQCSDPGIIPRRDMIQLMNDAKLKNYMAKDEIQPSEVTQVLVSTTNPAQITLGRAKVCTTCNILRPPRSAHCGSCDNCVLVHDHHCPFVNNCIGKNNYRWFISFVASVCALSVSVFAGLICFVVLIGSKDMSESSKLTVLIVFVVPIGIAGSCVLGLCCYHLFLRCIGKTTRENLKNQTTTDSENNQFLWFGGSETLFDPKQLIMVPIPQ